MDQRGVIPIITFTKETLKPGTESWKSTCKSVREALEGFSVFIAVYDELITTASVFSSLKEFFVLPKEKKLLNKSERDPRFGYFGETPGSLNETMGIEDSTNHEAVQSFANLMWPLGNHHFCERIHCYAMKVSKLEQIVTKMIFESYGVGKHCDSHTESTSHLFRANFYRVPQGEETNLGITAHADASFISVIKEDDVGGLEVQYSKDGNWIPVNFPPSSFAIMAGDALLAWSNGKIRPCFHRVIIGKKARMSVGIFSFHKGIIQVREELAGDGSLQFNSFDHFGLLKFRSKYPVLSTDERVKAYCGAQKDIV